MREWYETPLTFGEILDVTFRVIKENFVKLFLVMLIFMGPIFLLEGIGMLFSGMSFLPGVSTGAGSLFGLAAQPGNPGSVPNFAPAFFILPILGSLLFFVSLPMAFATLIIVTDQIRNDEEVSIASAIKQAFSRFWALLGGSIVYGLIGFGLYVAMGLLIVVYLAINGDLGSFGGLVTGRTAGFGKHILGMVVITLGAAAGFTYLMTRWSFFFPAIIFEPVSPGIGKSWQLTRGCFWRLTGLYFVVSIINGIIAMVLNLAISLLLRETILAFLLSSVVYLLVMAIPLVAYAVIYFDLRVRNDAGDLKSMLDSYQGNPYANYQSNSHVHYPDNSYPNFQGNSNANRQDNANASNQDNSNNNHQDNPYANYQSNSFVNYPEETNPQNPSDTPNQIDTPNQTDKPNQADTLNSTKPPWEA